MKKTVSAIVMFLVIGSVFRPSLFGKAFDADFSVVMIDDATEAKLGPFPYDRSILAQGIQACARLHAKAVILKFFIDLPKTDSGDEALATSFTAIPVALQASLGGEGSSSRQLPTKFKYSPNPEPAMASNDRGLIPLQRLLDAAAKVGFVDFPKSIGFLTQDIPLIESYQGSAYPSLILSCLEMATGDNASSRAPGQIDVGKGYLRVDSLNVHRAHLRGPATIKTISFVDLLDGKVSESEIGGKVVVIGLDTRKGPSVVLKNGPISSTIGLHRYFVLCLAAAYRDLMDSVQASR